MTIVDRGDEKGGAAAEYVIAFDASSSGMGTVAVSSAGLGTNEEAETQDLKDAAFSNTPVSVTINKIRHNVTLPSIFKGVETVEDGATYTFQVADDGANYVYSNVAATMNGNSVEVAGNSTDGWSIANVTGALVITGSRTERSFSVSIDGPTASNDGNTATYGTDYHFTLPTNVLPGVDVGHTYTLESVTIGGQPFTGTTEGENRAFTIDGEFITGDIVIVIGDAEIPANRVPITVTGAVGVQTNVTAETTAEKGGSFTLTITPEPGYVYTVTAAGYEVAQSGNNYTVTNIQNAVVFEITKTIPVNTVEVTEYSGMGGGNTLWLVKNTTEKLDGKTYQYEGQTMHWSDEYNAYFTLVVAPSQPEVSGNDFTIVSGTPTRTSTYDVNNTGHVDANDAQLVYNMYNTGYADFTANVTLEKFMNADVNNDGEINVNDVWAATVYARNCTITQR